MFRLMIAANLALGSLAMAGTGFAQESAAPANERVNMVIIFGDDECPAPKGNEITVCARKAESERYRIPEALRDGPKGPQSESWNTRVRAYERLSASGAQSCSPIGAGGWTGCNARFVQDAYAQKKAETDVNFSRMIEAERAKRAAKVDGIAAREQAEVEEAEKAYIAKRQKEAEEAEKKAEEARAKSAQ